MKNNLEQQLKKMRNIKLSEEEKRDLKASIDAHARVGDVRNANPSRQYEQRSHILAVFIKSKYSMTGLAIGLMLLVGGGTSFAAQDALPGDFLYPVKTEVNERVEGAFAIGAEAEAEFESERAERRLTEAQKLAAKGELNADTRAQVEQKFETHVRSALARAESLSGEAKADIATRIQSRIESALSAHADVLASAHGEADGDVAAASMQAQEQSETAATASTNARADMEAFIKNVRARASEAVEARVSTESRINAEGEVNIEAAARRMETAAQDKIDAVVRILDSGKIDAEISAKVQSHVDESNRLMAAGEADIENGDVRSAYRHFVESFQLANRIHVFLNAHINSGFRLANINIFTQGGGQGGGTTMMSVEPDEGSGAGAGAPGEGEMTACTMDAKQCPDGSYVGRTGPNCTFEPCPSEKERSEKEDTEDQTSEEDRGTEVKAESETEVETNSEQADVEGSGRVKVQFGF